jgi:hypothetical protein
VVGLASGIAVWLPGADDRRGWERGAPLRVLVALVVGGALVG